jgi:hypothetical protein
MIKSISYYSASLNTNYKGWSSNNNDSPESQISSSILAKLAEKERSEMKSKKFPHKRNTLRNRIF